MVEDIPKLDDLVRKGIFVLVVAGVVINWDWVVLGRVREMILSMLIVKREKKIKTQRDCYIDVRKLV